MRVCVARKANATCGAGAPPDIPRPAVFKGAQPAATGLAAAPNKRARFVSQITPPSPASGVSGPTPVSQAGFRKLVPGKGQQLTLLSLELHADTRQGPVSSHLSTAIA